MAKKDNLLSSAAVKVYCIIASIIVLSVGTTLFFYFHDFNFLFTEKAAWGIFGTFFGSIAGVVLSSFTFIILALSYYEQIRERKASAIGNDIQRSIELCEKILGNAIACRRDEKSSIEPSLHDMLIMDDPGLLNGNTGRVFKSNMLRMLTLLADVEMRFNELSKMGYDRDMMYGHNYCRHMMNVMKKWISRQRGNCVLDTYENFQDIIAYIDANI